MRTKLTLILAIFILALLLCACLGDDDSSTESASSESPAITTVQEPSGMDRFSQEAIEEHGCPDPAKVPAWLVIPECQ